jgi:hypothetical protein
MARACNVRGVPWVSRRCVTCGMMVGPSPLGVFDRCRACRVEARKKPRRPRPAPLAYPYPPGGRRQRGGVRPPAGELEANVAHYAARAALGLPLFGGWERP